MSYNDSFKEKIMQKLLMPRAPSLRTLEAEAGVPRSTLSDWKKSARIEGVSKANKGPDVSPRPATALIYTAEEKLALVLEAAALSDEQLGEFLRQRGLYSAQLTEWKAQALTGLRPARQDTVQAKKIAALERELKRKDKALAETAALLVLKKKVQEIWGDEADDTRTENDK
jgi:transposase